MKCIRCGIKITLSELEKPFNAIHPNKLCDVCLHEVKEDIINGRGTIIE